MSAPKPRASELPAEQPCPFVIASTGVYRPRDLAAGLRVPLSGILREIRAGRLRASRRRGRLLVLGSWALAWVEAGEVRRTATARGNGRQSK